ncbi:MAG: hypothetical protein K2P59_15045, partial [Acetatifactor sp.]|nr:hypothetical protein [Acetatifactor sp.]
MIFSYGRTMPGRTGYLGTERCGEYDCIICKELVYRTDQKKRREAVYRLIIADDEKRIRQGLKNIVDWER